MKLSVLALATLAAVWSLPVSAVAASAVAANPLLIPSPLPLNYPPFDKIQDSDFAPALDQGMAQQLLEVAAIADNPAAATFDNTIAAMEKSGRTLARASTVLFSLIGADTNPARQKLQSDYATKLAAHRDAISLNPQLYARIDALYQARTTLGLDAPSVRLIERYQRNLVRAGAQLNEADKTRMRAINAELASLSASFNRNVLAEVNDSAVVVDTAAELAGLTPEQIAGAAAAAKLRKLDGKYVIALLNTSGQPVLKQLENRALRERIHSASVDRNSRGNAFDTRAIVARTATLRAERAHLFDAASGARIEQGQ